MFYDNGEELYHYGKGHLDGGESGRYPWGSGENPYQRFGDILDRIHDLEALGKTEGEIARELGIFNDRDQPSVSRLRAQKAMATNERKMYEYSVAKKMLDSGLSVSEIGRRMGKNESSIRSLLNRESVDRRARAMSTANVLMNLVDEKGKIIDVGVGVEREMGVSAQKLKEALEICQMEGYEVYRGGMDNMVNPGKRINSTYLCPPGTAHKDIYDFNNVAPFTDYHSTDGGKTFNKLSYPKSIDSSRIEICYGDQGGKEKDGVIELRRGVEDISLGGSQYAQVRIAVDNKYYLKGMAIYSDNLPKGVDVRFNTNKNTGTPKEKVFKELSDDPDNPFGATIKSVEAGGQRWYEDEHGNKQLSVINKIRDQGDWEKYDDKIASQFLAKQSLKLINQQLNKTYDDYVKQFDEIKNYTNPTVKKKELTDLANELDAASSTLAAAALPRQSWQVILPVPSLKDNEIYAQQYRNGERVALVRYPHGGTFEIPICTVNNNHGDASKVLKGVTDAVGINSKVAERLSGADFDGDTVLVIPINDKVRITSKPNLPGLEGFDPKDTYSTEGMTGVRLMKKNSIQQEMGGVSNLITDMTLKGAQPEELARAVRHSMVVIDAYKHKLNYKQSEIDNGIKALKKKYQGREDAGAATLISRAGAETRIPERRGSPQYLEDGTMYYKESGRTYIDMKTGKEVRATTEVPRMQTVTNAHELSSGTLQENAYANYANRVKELAKAARKEMLSTPNLKYSPTAKKVYAEEVASLDSKLNLSFLNKPKEREAQRIANMVARAKISSNPDLEKKEKSRIKDQALNAARLKVGAKRVPIELTDREAEAIQAGAITDSKLKQILQFTDKASIRKLTTSPSRPGLSDSKIAQMKSMFDRGYTLADIADKFGISSSSVANYIKS